MNRLSRKRATRRGAVLVLLALVLPVVLMLSAYAMNLAYLELNRTELQISTDAAARSCGRELLYTGSTAAAIARNVLGKTIVLTGAMIPYAFGSSDGLFNLGSALSFVQVLPVLGRQRPRTVKWVPPVQTPPPTRRPPHWARRIRPQA